MARPREFDEDRVLDAVMETFWRNGYENTSAQDLVDATGLGRGSLYAAYASKDGLFEQALLRYRRRAQANAHALAESGSPIEQLRAFLHGIVAAGSKGPDPRGCLATNSAIEIAGRDLRVAALVRENFGILRRGIEHAIRRGQDTGAVRTDMDAEALALFVLNAVQGLRVLTQAATPKDRAKLTTVIDQTLAALT